MKWRLYLAWGLCLGLALLPVQAAEPLRVAVAANFFSSMQWLAAEYEKDGGVPVQIISGSTGKLFAQIRQGAPFDVFFAADSEHPRRLETEGRILEGSRATYAMGQLALWQRAAMHPPQLDDIRRSGGRVVLANPALAPYGMAAQEVLVLAGAWAGLQSRLLRAENVSQAFQYVKTGQADWGLLPLSLLKQAAVPEEEYRLLDTGYAPIAQQAVVLRGTREPAAAAFLAYCLADKARGYLLSVGYGVP